MKVNLLTKMFICLILTECIKNDVTIKRMALNEFKIEFKNDDPL